MYASMAYNELIKDTNIVRSMSRAGKPTDNPVNESLNGWIKEELLSDFGLEQEHRWTNIIRILDEYVKFYNEMRPCFAIGMTLLRTTGSGTTKENCPVKILLRKE